MTPKTTSRLAARRRVERSALAVTLLATAVVAGACGDEFIPDYNNPTLPETITDATQLQSQATGLVTGDREQHAFQILVLETMGRDVYRIDIADPRYLLQPLGQFNPGAFLADFTWNSLYRTILGAQKLEAGINGSDFAEPDKAATRGFANTFAALEYLRLIESRDTIGIPIKTGTGALDPVRCKPAVLTEIVALLDSADRDLGRAGDEFPFVLPSGFSDAGNFDTPAGFRRFNRGLAAKALTYAGFADFARNGSVNTTALNAALTALAASFENPAGPLRQGVFHIYSNASGDLANGNYDLSVYRANPKVLSESEAGDARLSKVLKDPAQRKENNDGSVASDILFTQITGPTTPLPILMNEELILVHAEVLWGLQRDAEALALVNVIRQRAGNLAPRTAGSFATRLDLVREILKQKRYSLLFESTARLVDMRMFGFFLDLGPELAPPGPGPRVIPFPQAEIDARSGDLTCQP